MNWRISVQEFLELEEFRNGQGPKFEIQFHSLSSKGFKTRLQNGIEEYVQTQPWSHYACLSVDLPIETWLEKISPLNIKNYLLLEFSTEPIPPELKGILKTYEKALRAFKMGGSEGWADCIAAVRMATEQIPNFKESLLLSPIGKSREVIEKWNKAERIRNLAWSIRLFSHLTHHPSDEVWTRDDAFLAPTSLSFFVNWLSKYSLNMGETFE